MKTYTFKKIEPTAEQWREIEGAYDSTCYQTECWYKYLKRIGVEPFVAEVYVATVDSRKSIDDSQELIGYFFGEKMRWGIPMITAPIEGIGTYTQGLNMLRETTEEERIDIYQALAKWIFKRGYALTMQVEDWQMRRDSPEWMPNEAFHHEVIEAKGVPYEVRPTLHVAVNKPEEELWAGLHYKSCKYSVNKAKKMGLYVKEITDYEEIPAFCKVHYDQLREVCINKGMTPKPGQSESRMRALCESLWPNRVMMIEVIGPDENGQKQVMSSGIFCVDKGQCAYWTGASYQRYLKFCPNELMVWEAMRLMSERGYGDLNFCGTMAYKLKFGTYFGYVPRLKFAKYKVLLNYTKHLKKFYYSFVKVWIIEPWRKLVRK